MNSQKANPGGNLAPNEIVGRDELIRRLWRTLERRSLYITAERRVGKTSVIRDKMGKEMPLGSNLIYLDVSKAVSPLEFIGALLQTCHAHLDTKTKAKFVFDSLASRLSGVSFKAAIGVTLPENLGSHWKKLLETLLDDLAALEPRVVLAFDELPLMLDTIRQRAGDAAGETLVMELLDTLRAVRQEKDLRMIYTGSLGLHHVLTLLREQGYQNDPTNDMAVIDLEPLTPEDATELARRLLRGEGVSCGDLNDVAVHLAQTTDNIPYYIQHLVAEIGLHEREGSREEVDHVSMHACVTRSPPGI